MASQPRPNMTGYPSGNAPVDSRNGQSQGQPPIQQQQHHQQQQQQQQQFMPSDSRPQQARPPIGHNQQSSAMSRPSPSPMNGPHPAQPQIQYNGRSPEVRDPRLQQQLGQNLANGPVYPNHPPSSPALITGSMSRSPQPSPAVVAPYSYNSHQQQQMYSTGNPSQQIRPPSALANGLSSQMSSMRLSPAPQLAHVPQPEMTTDAGPLKAKRAARAYHQEDNSPSAAFAQQSASGSEQHYVQQNQVMHPQQPIHPYVNAPPASAPGSQYSTQARPDYLQQSQPEGHALPPHQNSIPQPPHNPGTKLPGMRNRIDPEQIPSVVAVQEQDQDVYDAEPYMTCSRSTIPLSTTNYTSIDQGSSTPRFMRFTTYNLPASDELANLSHLPLSIVLQPFGRPHTEAGEDPIYTADFTQAGPPRCKRCRGYINPWCVFIEAGQKFVCNLCGNATEVPPDYFSHLDVNGRRLDFEQRPELMKGSIDMLVPKDYWVQDPPIAGSSSASTVPRPPQPLHYVFAIDVSCDTTRRSNQGPAGQQEPQAHPMLREVCQALKDVIYGSAEVGQAEEQQLGRKGLGLPPGAKVAFMTFDKVVHFYNIKSGLDKPQMLVVGDVDDIFVPLNEGFLVDALESRSLVETLLDSIPSLFAHNVTADATLGGALKAALLALKTIGGQLNIFQTRLPMSGPGALKHRDETKLQGTDKERTLFVPQDIFYRNMAEEAVESGIGINLFLFPSQYIDVASLGVLAGLTGGDVYFHPRFDPVRDYIKLHSQLSRTLTRETAYSVTMRIRCSEGLRVSEHYGNFYQRNVTDLEFGTMDADKAVTALLKHESKLDDKRDAYFQCAVLYTSSDGHRKVRLHNIAVPVTQIMANVFRYADMDATMTHCAKEAIAKTVNKPLREVRDQLTELCTKVLLAYRKHCASTTAPGQLILPESFKLFPVFALSFIKTKALKGGPVVSDVRTYSMRYIKGMGASDTMELLYPKMLPVHTLAPNALEPDANGRIRLPRMMRTSYARMEPHGAYLVQNGELAILWLGAAVSPQILRDLYDVDSLEEVNTRMTRLPRLPTRLSEQLRTIMQIWEDHRSGRRLPLYVARQNMDGIEVEFSNMLVEDANNDNLSYVDYLCFVHKNIQTELSGEKQQAEVDAQHMWRSW